MDITLTPLIQQEVEKLCIRLLERMKRLEAASDRLNEQLFKILASNPEINKLLAEQEAHEKTKKEVLKLRGILRACVVEHDSRSALTQDPWAIARNILAESGNNG